jgi:hypothetical protein
VALLAHASLSDGHLLGTLLYAAQVWLCVLFTAWCARVWQRNRRSEPPRRSESTARSTASSDTRSG